uniref:Uncharacterized protein n=1 Tax=uncultured prokaryote TaxID=198431 RepID=A0A0H5Q3U4_9ZZZZ|nr:hypothetical protein [uncultured prokaryote]
MAFNKVEIKGTLASGDVWSINPCFAGGAVGSVTAYEALLDWATAVVALNAGDIFPTEVLDIMSTAVTITSVRIGAYTADGELVQAAEVNATDLPTGSSTPTNPGQSALVVSLLSGRPGRSYNGRLFLPCLAPALNTLTLRIGGSVARDVAAGMAAWLTDVADASGETGAYGPVIVSHKLGTSVGVSSVRVGDVVDTQRRRRDAVKENYSTAPIAN